MSKSTRSSTSKLDADEPPKSAKILALRKVFYISERILSTVGDFRLEKFYHPGKGKKTFFITSEQKGVIMEILEFAEPRRSWLINQDVCSNGKLYLTAPLEVIFLVLHHLRKYCSKNAMSLDSIRDDQDDSLRSLLMTYARPEQLKCIADAKTAGDMTFYKYNAEKTIAWLALKVRRTADLLRRNSVYCGVSALSQNYAKSEGIESISQASDYLRTASDIVGSYIDLELHEELKEYLSLPTEQDETKKKTETSSMVKRKSLQTLNDKANKKIKLDKTEPADENAINNSLNESTEEKKTANVSATPHKDRVVTAKEKALAKSAKGSKNISSYFKR